jgi:hypothetical protein
MVKQLLVGQVVINDHLCLTQAFNASQGDQPGVTGAGPDQVNDTVRH